MATRLPIYLMRDGRTRLGQGYFNPVWADLDSRLDALERLKVDWNAQVSQLRELGLVRIDDYIRPLTEELDQLLAQGQQTAAELVAVLENLATTDSRTDDSTERLLQAKAMNDHRQSGDHDARYYRKHEIDAARQAHNESGDHDERYYRKEEINATIYSKQEIDNSISTKRYDVASTAASATLNLASQQVFRVSATNNRALSFSNAPGSGRAMTVVIRLTGSNGTITWPSGIIWDEGAAPELRDSWTAVALLWDGTHWYGFVSGGAD